MTLGFAAGVCSVPLTVGAISDRERADEVAVGVREGSVEWMTAGEDRFPVVVREAVGEEAAGIVLIVPEPGAHADWPDVVRPLRLGLAAHGWRTLSLQMPGADARGNYRNEQTARARVAHLLERLDSGDGQRLVVLAQGRAYSVVVTLLLEMIPQRPDLIAGLVLISPELPAPGVLGEVEDPLREWPKPLLELRGGESVPGVRRLLDAHARLAASGLLPARREMVVPGATGDYRAQSDMLVRRVRGWLTTLPPAGEAAPP